MSCAWTKGNVAININFEELSVVEEVSFLMQAPAEFHIQCSPRRLEMILDSEAVVKSVEKLCMHVGTDVKKCFTTQ